MERCYSPPGESEPVEKSRLQLFDSPGSLANFVGAHPKTLQYTVEGTGGRVELVTNGSGHAPNHYAH